MFTTTSSLNKWAPYTISGATFNDTNKTITVSGTTALSGLTTDVTIPSPSTNQMLAYNGTKWTNQSLIGAPNGVCDLNSSGMVNPARLPYSSSVQKNTGSDERHYYHAKFY